MKKVIAKPMIVLGLLAGVLGASSLSTSAGATSGFGSGRFDNNFNDRFDRFDRFNNRFVREDHFNHRHHRHHKHHNCDVRVSHARWDWGSGSSWDGNWWNGDSSW